ncbi:MAG: hypothetical protein COX79_01890 [Candidatus Levybacteria bacterium CG_4_10_14_0_2_um_filter_36_16]|nr:MAG: hypothetical protein AUK12_02680 [Candidatus Levybacteria bacterium CG2_30_37_29]PIR78888.1 MAG: hypothetical protein COU26_04160 [Candidatus Levybacteria bacterium CG10_big_fil_rev_8_21_14_0_10_36_30]PIZ97484.1 MAG: hypothetical protein COX79_01890 [Candidatus Levybacteria bacterium CG_4_10_14_0_2_um_filter_36_16]
MGIENYFAHPVDQKDVESFQRRKNFLGPAHSNIDAVALDMAQEGKNALSSFVVSNVSPDGMIYFTPSFMREMGLRVGTDIVGIHLAASILSLGETMVERQFDLKNHVARLNWYLSDFPPSQMNIENAGIEAIPYRKLRDMWALARCDRTLSRFFTTDTNLLPDYLRSLLDNTVMKDIPAIIKHYEHKSGRLLAALESLDLQEDEKRERGEVYSIAQKKFLDDIDLQIAILQEEIDDRRGLRKRV